MKPELTHDCELNSDTLRKIILQVHCERWWVGRQMLAESTQIIIANKECILHEQQ